MPKKTISGWALQVTWDDGKEETITEIDDDTAGAVDTFLTELEKERAIEERIKRQASSSKQRLTTAQGECRMYYHPFAGIRCKTQTSTTKKGIKYE